ncbi:MAG: TetR/AcrR family transcriptional regulator [Bullifex sp.]
MSQLTKLALENSLKKLLAEKPLNRITISDITNDCGVNRMTFYYHFRDIYDLIEWSCMEDAGKIVKNIDLNVSWQQAMTEILRRIKENKIFLMNVYRCVSRDEVEKILHVLLDPLITKVITELSADMNISDTDRSFVARVYSYCFIGIFLDWVRDDMRDDPEKLSERFALAIKDAVHVSLGKFRKQ